MNATQPHVIDWYLANATTNELASWFIDECVTPETVQQPAAQNIRPLIYGIMHCLIYQRDHRSIPLLLADIDSAMDLDHLIELANDPEIDRLHRSFLHQYLISLPRPDNTMHIEVLDYHQQHTLALRQLLSMLTPHETATTPGENIYQNGTADSIHHKILSDLRQSGRSVSHERTVAFVRALARCLTYLRDRGDLLLDANMVRSYLTLECVCELALNSDLPEMAVTPLRQYLRTLPGYDELNAREGFLSTASKEQHGLIALPLTEI